MTDESAPARQSADDARASVHGAVLAAGTSSRYGAANKLLEPLDGEPLVRHAVQTACAAPLDGVTVVVGHQADRVRNAVADLAVDVWTNEAFETGQSTSVAAAVDAARERDADAALVALGDMPAVDVESVEVLVDAYRQGVGDAVAAAYDGRRGNPVLFDSRFFDALTEVDGDIGGREVFAADPDAVTVETGDPGVVHDVDRPADLDG